MLLLLFLLFYEPKEVIYTSGVIEANVVEREEAEVEEVTKVGRASWYGFESCENERCLQSNGMSLVEGDDGMACSSDFRLGDRVRISHNDVVLLLRCTDRGGFEKLGRTFDLHRWNFAVLSPLSKGVIEVNYERL